MFSTRSRYTPAFVPDQDPWDKAYYPDTKNQICEAIQKARWLRVCDEIRLREHAEALILNPLLGLPRCVHCNRYLPEESFFPEIGGTCKDCCEKIWERMQKKGREDPEGCARIAIEKFGYWRTYGHRDHIEYRLIRRKRMEYANYQCEHCGSKRRLSLHHLTYVRIFNELLADVQILCRSCHPKADAERRRMERENHSCPPDLLAAIKRENRHQSGINRRLHPHRNNKRRT